MKCLWVNWVAALAVTVAISSAENSLSDRVPWTGTNGVTIYGTYLKEEGGKVHIADVTKVYKIARENLSPQTLEWMENAKIAAAAKARAATPPGVMPRSIPGHIPAPPPGYTAIDATKLDLESFPYLPEESRIHHAFAPFFVRWDEAGLIPIPRGRDAGRKADWVADELDREFRTRSSSVPPLENVGKGFTKFFERRFEGVAKCHLTRFILDPAQLPKHLATGSAVVLGISVKKDLKDKGALYHASLLAAEPDGRVIFYLREEKYFGVIKPLPDREDAYRGIELFTKQHEIVLYPSTPWKRGGSPRLVIAARMSWGGLFILTPFVKEKEEGDAPEEK